MRLLNVVGQLLCNFVGLHEFLQTLLEVVLAYEYHSNSDYGQVAHWHQKKQDRLLPRCKNAEVDGAESRIGHGASAQKNCITIGQMKSCVTAIENAGTNNNNNYEVGEMYAIEIPMEKVFVEAMKVGHNICQLAFEERH